MLWLRREDEFVASTPRGQYVVYRAGGRTFAAMFKPAGTHARTRDIGVRGSLGEAKGLAERHALAAMGAAAYSRAAFASRLATVTRLPSNFKPQSLLFPKSRYSAAKAVAWARERGWRYDKVDTGKGRYIRLRQFDPSLALEGRHNWATVTFGKGIKAVFARVPRQVAAAINAERRAARSRGTRELRRAA